MTINQPSCTRPNALQRHSRLVSVVGALIIFATFIVKDALRDNLKDLTSSLSNAQAGFALRSDNTTLSDKIVQLDGKIDTLIGRPAGMEDPMDRRWGQAAGMLSVAQENFAYGWDELDRVNDVVTHLRNPDAYSNQIKDLKSRIQHSLANGNAIVDRFQPSMIRGQNPSKYYTDAGKCVIASRELRDQAVELVTQILAGAKAQLDSDEPRVTVYTRVSYGLYGLGWSLALLGRLYGVDGIGSEE